MAALGIFSRMKKAVQSPFNRTPQVEHNKDQAADMVGLDQVFLHYFHFFGQGVGGGAEGGGTSFDEGEAPPGRGTFFRLQVCERVGVSIA